MAAEDWKQEPLESEIGHIIEESRMVLPGIQALFGFQLIAVFNPHFSEALAAPARLLHLGAIILTACSIALIMAPAAYHRQAERDRISHYFARYASRLITIAMAPLVVAIAIEVSLVSFAITHSLLLAACLGIVLTLLYTSLWYFYPRIARARA